MEINIPLHPVTIRPQRSLRTSRLIRVFSPAALGLVLDNTQTDTQDILICDSITNSYCTIASGGNPVQYLPSISENSEYSITTTLFSPQFFSGMMQSSLPEKKYSISGGEKLQGLQSYFG